MVANRGGRFYTAVALLILTGGAMSHAQSKFVVDFTWEGTAKCFDPKSPPFSVSGVPAGTKVLRFVMTDLDAPGFPHGGGSVPYSGQSRIERGAFAYKGPCPPQGQHSYQWTVDAQGATGEALATTNVTKKFPPG